MAEQSGSRKLTAIGTALIVLALVATVGAIAFGVVTHDDTAGEGGGSAGGDAGERPPGFVYAEDGQFMLDGEPFAYAGANAYTLMLEAEPTVDVYMQQFVDSNLTVARAWAFFDYGTQDGEGSVEIDTRGIYFHYWDEAAGAPAFNEGPNGLQKLDYMIASAAEHDIKLVLPFVNNWVTFGGIDQYVRWADGTWHDDFFRDEQIKGWYKDWVAHLLERENTITGVKYKDDPTIMAWELGNELRCSESGPYPSSQKCGSQVFVDWADEMSTYVKSIDPHHMVGFGGEGFLCTEPGGPSTLFNCAESGDPVKITNLPNIDMNGIHVYPNHWNPEEPTDDWEEWGAWWIEQHGQIAADAGKPFFIGEYGWIDQSERMLVFDHWLQAFYDAGGDGSHFWLMQPASSIAAPADGVGFSQRCPGSACDLVSNWSAHMRDGVPWDDFGPIADSDIAAALFGETIEIDVLANDKVYAPATWDTASVDLDPETAGVQTTYDTGRGILTVTDGVLTFASHPSESGTARGAYVVTDSEGRTSGEARISITRADDPAALEELPEA